MTAFLDIGKDMDKVTGNEKIFYEDPNSPKECHVSKETDLEYAETERKEMLKCQAKEEKFILGDIEQILLQNNSNDETNQLDVSIIRSGYVRNTVIAVDVGVQFDSAVVCPRICKVCDSTNKIKSESS